MSTALGSSQEWKVTSPEAAGDLIFLSGRQPDSSAHYINLSSYTLTANIGAGRLINATSGRFQGAGGSIIKTGAGTMILGQANTYTGNTTVHGGTLRLTSSGTIANSPTITVGDAGSSGAVLEKIGTFTVGSTQTLAGIGTVDGAVSVAAGGTLAPGASVGTLTVDGNLTLADGALLNFELDTPAASDKVSMTANTLTLNGQEWPDFTFTTLGGFGVGTYVLIDAGTVSGSLGASVVGTVGGLNGELSIDLVNNDLILTVSAGSVVPAIDTLDPVDGGSDVFLGADLVITFDRSVAKGTGDIVIYESGGTEFDRIDVATAQVTVDGAQVTITPSAPFAPGTGYYMLIDNGAIADFGGISDPAEWNFTTEAAPAIVDRDPLDNDTEVPIGTDLVVIFDKTVLKGSGNVVIKKTSDNTDFEVIDVTSGQVTLTGDQMTINPTGTLAYNTAYHVLIDNGAITGFTGISDPAAWNFTTEAAPAIVDRDPLDDASGVLITTNLALIFDKAVTKGAGNIVIKKSSDNTEFEVIDVTSGQVTVSGTDVIINPAGTLAYATDYHVLVDSGAITGFAGISDPTAWNFTTEAGPTVFAFTPEDGETNVPTATNLVIDFDKPVTKGAGNIVIKKASDNTDFEVIDVTSGKVTVSGTVVTINPAAVLALSTGYFVQIDAGAIAGFAGIADTTTWNFTTTAEPPAIVSLSPPDDASSVETNPLLTITFDREVGTGTGNIVIRKSSDNTVFDTIDVTSGQVTVGGAQVWIDPALTLDAETSYYVEVDNGALAGFAGISGSTAWNFTTWQDLGQDVRRFDGSSGVEWNTAANWTDPNVPNSALEAAIFDGHNGGRTFCGFNIDGTTTIGQISIRSPQTVTRIYRDRLDSSPDTLILAPATGFGGIGIDMSTATVNFGFQSYNQSSNREMILTLGSDQQWNVTSTATAGDLIFLQNGQELGTGQKINLQGFALTANVGAGRTMDASNGGYIQGTGSIIKTGDGLMILGTASPYSGNTTVQAGTLRLTGSGSIANSPVITVGDTGSSGAVLEKTSGTFNIGSTQTLKGIGTVSGTVSVAAGGTLAPGASVGTLTVDGNLTLATGAVLAYELDTPAASDQVAMTANTLNLNGQEWADFTFTTDTGFGVGTYVLIDAGAVTGSLGASVTGTIGVLYGQLSVDPVEHDLILTVSTSATTYTVTYDGNGNDGGSPPVDANSPYLSGATVTVLGNTGGLTLTGSTFAGWNTADDGSGTPYAPSATFPMPAANLTLYAQWTVAGGFSTWADANAGGQGPEGDFNGNGVPNGVEYLMGGTLANPATLPMPVNTGGTWTWTLPYDPAATDAAWKFQVSEDLETWTDHQQGDPEVAVLTGPDELELTLPASATGKKFARLVVTIP